MMIFNCSAAAAEHLYGKYKKGHDEGFFEPASPVQQTIAERQEALSSQGVIQWVVHAVKVGRSTCLIAMEFNTRWAHVIHQVRKGDVNGFVERLNGRLINGVEWLGTDFSLLTTEQMEVAIERYFTLHRELRFYQQTDRSAITHINQVCATYKNVYHDIGTFPADDEIALEFDLRLNRDWRCRKGEPFDLRVDEKMLVHWMVQYAGKTQHDAEQSVAIIREAERAMSMNRMDFEIAEQLLSDARGRGSNILDMAEFRKTKK
ncbi:TPA: hypothetical protein QHU17_003998 [Enterobacter hormaechei subsp. xiangfangensis]|nr:hypothetical protein [Enterobacter hormaechei subsp. xiangfangensis]